VAVGDVFLFFGWFRKTRSVGGRYCFVHHSSDLHVIFGWLQVGAVLHVNQDSISVPAWARYHPHLRAGFPHNNTLYAASESLQLDSIRGSCPGGGVFERYSEDLCLTAPGSSRTVWRLPEWFHPKGGRPPFTYHSDLSRWTLQGRHTILRSAMRGQEFVLDTDLCPEAVLWVRDLIVGSSLCKSVS
jgi:hypothetical protein